MNEQEFTTQIQRLKETFPGNTYSLERVRLIGQEVRNESVEWFARVITEIIGNSRQAPLVDEFRNLARQERAKRYAIQKSQNSHDDFSASKCSYCFGVGYFICVNNSKPGLWPFKCDCGFGLSHAGRFPDFKEEHKQDGFYWVDAPAAFGIKKRETA